MTEDYKANEKTMEIVVLEGGNEITDELGLTVTIESVKINSKARRLL